MTQSTYTKSSCIYRVNMVHMYINSLYIVQCFIGKPIKKLSLKLGFALKWNDVPTCTSILSFFKEFQKAQNFCWLWIWLVERFPVAITNTVMNTIYQTM